MLDLIGFCVFVGGAVCLAGYLLCWRLGSLQRRLRQAEADLARLKRGEGL